MGPGDARTWTQVQFFVSRCLGFFQHHCETEYSFNTHIFCQWRTASTRQPQIDNSSTFVQIFWSCSAWKFTHRISVDVSWPCSLLECSAGLKDRLWGPRNKSRGCPREGLTGSGRWPGLAQLDGLTANATFPPETFSASSLRGVGLHSKSTFFTQTKGGWFLYATGGNLWAKGREESVLQGFPEPPQHVQTSAAQKHTGGGGGLIKYSAANEWASVSLPLPVCDWRHGCFHGGDFLATVESAEWVQLKFTATSRRREARRMVGDGVLLDIWRPEEAWLEERDRTSLGEMIR